MQPDPLPRSTPVEEFDRFVGDAREIPGVGTEIVIDRSPSRPAGWDTPQLSGSSWARGRRASNGRRLSMARGRSHPVRSSDSYGDRTRQVHALAADFRAAVFWYSERPGPEPAAP
jgi:hypothetical protein